MTPLEMLDLPAVLHVLPTFDTGGLGSLAREMIDAWPVPARHLAIAPKYRPTKPDLFLPFAERIGLQNCLQLDRHAWEQAPGWIGRLQAGILTLLRGRGITNAIVYNFTDAGLSAQAIRRCGFAGQVASHVGTVLPDNETTRVIARAKLNLTFVPASSAVDVGLRKLTDENSKIHPVVWNGVDLPKYAGLRAYLPESRALQDGEEKDLPSVVFGFSGRMANPPVKDWTMLFDAFRMAAIPGAQLRIAGDGPLLAQLKAKAQGLDVVFTGQLNSKQMIEFLHGLDVFVMAALPFEGFSMALVEAIAAGCMIIGTDVPSVREVFEAGGELAAYLARSVGPLASIMSLFQYDSTTGTRGGFRHDNLAMVKRLQPMLDAKRMALAYSEIK